MRGRVPQMLAQSLPAAEGSIASVAIEAHDFRMWCVCSHVREETYLDHSIY